jgi:4-amino-4-deoxy-L-arabinose transferase-like glycosyltransferase/lipid-A-disaccharide synthase-like uncharacterized protein
MAMQQARVAISALFFILLEAGKRKTNFLVLIVTTTLGTILKYDIAQRRNETDMKINQFLREAFSGSHRAESVCIVLLTLLGIGVMFVQLGYPELGGVHEARVVVVAENMVQRGDWIVPVFNDRVRLEKPPLSYWGVAMARAMAGSMHEQMFRMPSALMGAAGVVMAAVCAGLMFGRRVVLPAGLFTAMMLRYVIEARTACVDIYLTFCVTLCLLLSCIIFFGVRRRDWLWLLLGAAVAAGGLAKGPVIFIFAVPLIVLGVALYPDRRPSGAWFAGFLAVFAGVSAIWPLLLTQQLGWDTIREVWASDIMRNVGSFYRRQRPWHFYLTRYLMLAFPWSILAAAAALLPLWKEVRLNRVLWRKTLFLSLTIVASVVFFSFIRKKKLDYIVPLVPVIGILIAAAWDIICKNIAQRSASLRGNKMLLSAQAVLFIAMGAVALAYVPFDTFGRVAILILTGAALCVGGAAGIYYINKEKLVAALLAQSAGFVAFGYLFFGMFLPQENVRISPGRFCAEVKDVIGDAPVVYFKGKDETLVYHLGRTIHRADTQDQLRQFLAEHSDGFVLVRHRNLQAAQAVAEHIVFHHPRMRDLELPLPTPRVAKLDDYDDNGDGDSEDEEGDTGYYYNMYVLTAGDWTGQVRKFGTFEVISPSWLTAEFVWVGFGLLAQTLFFMRFFVQWIASEKAKQSVMPIGFWWLSLGGGVMLLAYSIYRKDPVFIIGQSTGVFIYVRNLRLIYAHKKLVDNAAAFQSELLDDEIAEKTDLVSDEKKDGYDR